MRVVVIVELLIVLNKLLVVRVFMVLMLGSLVRVKWVMKIIRIFNIIENVMGRSIFVKLEF